MAVPSAPRVGQRARQLHDLEREAGRRGDGVGAHVKALVAQPRHQLGTQVGCEAGLLAHREQGADLHTGRTGRERGGQTLRGAVCPGQPERQAQGGDLVEVGVVTGPEDGLPEVVERQPCRGAARCAHRRAGPR